MPPPPCPPADGAGGAFSVGDTLAELFVVTGSDAALLIVAVMLALPAVTGVTVSTTVLAEAP